MLDLWLAFFLLSALTAPPAGEAPAQAPSAAAPPMAGEARPADPNLDAARRLAAAKAQIRRHVALMYGDECGAIELPDEAFMPVEISGHGEPELALSLAMARCPGMGASAFTGTGGVEMQFWRFEDGRVRLLLEQSMHGFTPASPWLVTWQHGGFCPGGAGPQQCRVVYRWDSLGQRLETEGRQLMGDERPTFDYETLVGHRRCSPAEAARGRCRR